MSYLYDYPQPSITGDVIVYDRRADKVLLIKRKHAPFKDHWAIVGGFFNSGDADGVMDESVRDAAIRELKEEVNIDVKKEPKLGRFTFTFLTIQDKPNRDPRNRVVTMVYVCTIWDGAIDGLNIKAQDDALEMKWFDRKDILDGKVPLAFDHLDSIQKHAKGIVYV